MCLDETNLSVIYWHVRLCHKQTYTMIENHRHFLPCNPLKNIEWVSRIAKLSTKTSVSPAFCAQDNVQKYMKIKKIPDILLAIVIFASVKFEDLWRLNQTFWKWHGNTSVENKVHWYKNRQKADVASGYYVNTKFDSIYVQKNNSIFHLHNLILHEKKFLYQNFKIWIFFSSYFNLPWIY